MFGIGTLELFITDHLRSRESGIRSILRSAVILPERYHKKRQDQEWLDLTGKKTGTELCGTDFDYIL